MLFPVLIKTLFTQIISQWIIANLYQGLGIPNICAPKDSLPSFNERYEILSILIFFKKVALLIPLFFFFYKLFKTICKIVFPIPKYAENQFHRYFFPSHQVQLHVGAGSATEIWTVGFSSEGFQ